MRRTGGVTLTRYWQLAEKGWIVASIGNELMLDKEKFTVGTLFNYITQTHPMLWGTWLNQKNQRIYLDHVRVFDNEEEAISFGAANKQLFLYNSLTEEELDLRPYYDPIEYQQIELRRTERASLRLGGEARQVLGFEEQRERAYAWARGTEAALQEAAFQEITSSFFRTVAWKDLMEKAQRFRNSEPRSVHRKNLASRDKHCRAH
ncbi:MAG: hypothetical protein U0R69_02060 [Gaiellales bacterium]